MNFLKVLKIITVNILEQRGINIDMTKNHYLNANIKEFYNENGYAIIENVFDLKDATIFNNCMRRHANKDFAAIINPDRYSSLMEQDERPKSDITLEEIKETSDLALSIIKSEQFIKILQFLHHKPVIGLSSQFIFKEAYSAYSNQAWNPHQDNYYPNNKNGAYLTLNWFFKDADKENGTIYCYPGSHKLGLLDAKDNISFREKVNTNPGSECIIPEEFKDKKKDLIIPGNSIVILHGNCIHGSYPNNSNRSRPWFSSCYITDGEEFLIGKSSKREKIHLSDNK